MQAILKKYRKLATKARDARLAHERSVEKFVTHALDHLHKHPLSGAQKKSILDAFREGKPLCCEHGRLLLWLELRLDDCWSDYINMWAYESIGCSEDYQPGGRLFEEAQDKIAHFLAKPIGHEDGYLFRCYSRQLEPGVE
jgi:hypothetical protein